ncbi:hypothetical protein [Actinoplanes teichomyceticus]|uniref:Uncharacterized protein n=1 Tax=Actinoplanes teichomyceticus TaxID=1867 RepID=A0A561W9S4_ACTTI|nr:hypothetical protein [Actinoplanes teichomyceticus]TWG20593.1 hypothetical protein FHX34_103121 [Actinoplanes teichomyceticus]GIF15929.1 hypothetical protein Ate01nite_59610 [Actinoplanes teichomyceticus]
MTDPNDDLSSVADPGDVGYQPTDDDYRPDDADFQADPELGDDGAVPGTLADSPDRLGSPVGPPD